MTDAIQYLKQVEERAKELYAMSDQGPWAQLHPDFQKMWINMADEELRPKK